MADVTNNNCTIYNRAQVKYNYTVDEEVNKGFAESETVSTTINPPVLPGTPSISAVKLACKKEVLVGEKITYNIVVTNSGTTDLTNISVTDTMVGGTFDSISLLINDTEIDITPTGDGPFTLSAPSDTILEPGKSAIFTCKVLPNDGATTVSNSALATGSDPKTPDTPVTDETETTETTVKDFKDLTINKEVDKNGPVECEDPLTYTLTIENPGSEPMDGVVIEDYFDGAFVFTDENGIINNAVTVKDADNNDVAATIEKTATGNGLEITLTDSLAGNTTIIVTVTGTVTCCTAPKKTS